MNKNTLYVLSILIFMSACNQPTYQIFGIPVSKATIDLKHEIDSLYQKKTVFDTLLDTHRMYDYSNGVSSVNMDGIPKILIRLKEADEEEIFYGLLHLKATYKGWISASELLIVIEEIKSQGYYDFFGDIVREINKQMVQKFYIKPQMELQGFNTSERLKMKYREAIDDEVWSFEFNKVKFTLNYLRTLLMYGDDKGFVEDMNEWYQKEGWNTCISDADKMYAYIMGNSKTIDERGKSLAYCLKILTNRHLHDRIDVKYKDTVTYKAGLTTLNSTRIIISWEDEK